MNLRPMLQLSVLLLVGTLCFSVEMPQANGQGILQRLRSRMQSPAPRPQYRPEYRPQTPAPGTNAQTRQGTKPTQTQTDRIDPRTGRVIAVPTPSDSTAGDRRIGGRPIQVQPTRTIGPKQSQRTNAGDAKQQAQPTLGLRVVQSASGSIGLDVLNIQSHSLADEAGLKVGDRIVALNGQATTDVESLSRTIQSARVGQTGVLRVVRGNRVADLRVPVVARPIGNVPPAVAATGTGKPQAAALATDAAQRNNGVQLGINIEDRQGVRGVIITSVDPDSPAAAAGIQAGDRLVAVDGRMVVNSDALAQELSARSSEESMSVQLVRGNQVRASTVSFAANTPNSSPIKTGPTPTTPTPTSKPSAGGSMFGGVGSIVGSLFGGGESNAAKTPDNKEADKKTTAKQSDLSATPAQPANASPMQTPQVKAPLAAGKSILVPSEPAKAKSPTTSPEMANPVVRSTPAKNTNPVAQVGHADDEMAFGDDEPINQAVFAQPLPSDAIPERDLELNQPSPKAPVTDPPSAAKITPPLQPENLGLNPPESLPTSARDRIKELESELKRLKKLLSDK